MELFKDEKLDSIEFLKLLYQKGRVIIIAIIASFILSLLVTYLIPPKYLSYGIIFPPNSNSLEEVIDRPDFGFDLQADRLMQILESQVMRDSIIKIFNLKDYYEIDTTNLDWNFKLDKKYTRDITFLRSKYMSIVISAKTKSPELSAEIVNKIIDLVDGMREEIFKENFRQELATVHANYLEQEKVVDSLRQHLNSLLDQDKSGKLRAIYYGLNNSKEAIDLLGTYKDLSLDAEQLIHTYLREKSRLNDLKGRHEYTKNKIERPFAKVYLVNRATPSYRKVSPSYRLNALIAVGVALLLTILVLLFAQKFQAVKEQITN